MDTTHGTHHGDFGDGTLVVSLGSVSGLVVSKFHVFLALALRGLLRIDALNTIVSEVVLGDAVALDIDHRGGTEGNCDEFTGDRHLGFADVASRNRFSHDKSGESASFSLNRFSFNASIGEGGGEAGHGDVSALAGGARATQFDAALRHHLGAEQHPNQKEC